MDIQEILVSYVLPYIPTILAVISAVTVVLKGAKAFKDLKQEVSDSNNVKELLSENRQLLEDNKQLKSEIRELTAQITKIKKRD